jgi:hypothetical protein
VAAQPSPNPAILVIRPPEIASMSFLFDDCGEEERGDRVRWELEQAIKLCPVNPRDGASLAGRLDQAVAAARQERASKPQRSVADALVCKDKRAETWGTLFDLANKLDAWRARTLSDEQIARVVCS